MDISIEDQAETHMNILRNRNQPMDEDIGLSEELSAILMSDAEGNQNESQSNP